MIIMLKPLFVHKITNPGCKQQIVADKKNLFSLFGGTLPFQLARYIEKAEGNNCINFSFLVIVWKTCIHVFFFLQKLTRPTIV